jgi:hypothetical protein
MLRPFVIGLMGVVSLSGTLSVAGAVQLHRIEKSRLHCQSSVTTGDGSGTAGQSSFEITYNQHGAKFIPAPGKENEYVEVEVPWDDPRPGNSTWITDTTTWRILDVDAAHSQSFAAKYKSLCKDGCAYHSRATIDAGGQFFVAIKPTGKHWRVGWTENPIKEAYPEPEYANLPFALYSASWVSGVKTFFAYDDPLDSRHKETGDCYVIFAE